MKALSALSLSVVCLAAACGRGPVRLETRTFALHHLSLWEARSILSPYVDSERPGAKGAMSTGSNTVTVRETADNLDRIGRVLTQFDLPQPGVRLTFKLIQADGTARTDSSIRDVEAALRSLFRFRGYSLVAEGVVTGSQNSRTEQTLTGSGGPYRLQASIDRIAGAGDSATVTLAVQLIFPGPGGEFRTTVGIPTGKTAVLGNVRGGSSNTALILAVRPDLVTN